MISEFVLDPLRGRTRLWRVVWLYGFVAGACLSTARMFFLPAPASNSAIRSFASAGLLLSVYELIASWQCAYNNPSRFLARLVRTAVILSFISMPLFIYLLIVDPSAISF
jgi:hypothetical protein